MLNPFPHNDYQLHPILVRTLEQIRSRRKGLSDLCTLGLDPLFESVSGTLNGEDVFILNEVHRSKGLRKLHLEIAFLGDGLQILHCVFFPEPIFDLPVFGVDIVIGSGGVSAAIVDLSPVRNKLPDKIIYSLERLEKPSFKIKRDLPKWGDIFSSYVLFFSLYLLFFIL